MKTNIPLPAAIAVAVILLVIIGYMGYKAMAVPTSSPVLTPPPPPAATANMAPQPRPGVIGVRSFKR